MNLSQSLWLVMMFGKWFSHCLLCQDNLRNKKPLGEEQQEGLPGVAMNIYACF